MKKKAAPSPAPRPRRSTARTDAQGRAPAPAGPVPGELVRLPVKDLKPHPRNYRRHPEAELVHIERSLREHGVYRNVVVARDGTLLAGHGVIEAARRVGLTEVPVYRIDLEPDDPRALKLLVGDNELARLATADQRELTRLLEEVTKGNAGALVGTGYDREEVELLMQSLAALSGQEVDVTEAWRGMPEFRQGDLAPFRTLHVHFKDEAAVAAFVKLLGQSITDRTRFLWYPELPDGTPAAKQFVPGPAERAEEEGRGPVPAPGAPRAR